MSKFMNPKLLKRDIHSYGIRNGIITYQEREKNYKRVKISELEPYQPFYWHPPALFGGTYIKTEGSKVCIIDWGSDGNSHTPRILDDIYVWINDFDVSNKVLISEKWHNDPDGYWNMLLDTCKEVYYD